MPAVRPVTSRKLALLIPGLTGGGAEKVLVKMANHWAAAGDEVTLITLSGMTDDAYPVSPEVRRIALDLQGTSSGSVRALLNNIRRIRAVRRALVESRPDAVISFIDQMNVTTLLASLGRRWPVVVSERVDPRYHRLGTIWSALRRLTYPLSSCLVVQTEDLARYCQRWVRRRRLQVIANGVEPPQVALLPMQQRRPVIVVAGRLVRQKGMDLLIEAFATVADDHPDWSVEIYGTGPLQGRLQGQIDALGLAERITLCGWSGDLATVFANSAVFALSSRYEGFPNVLLEAMSCGAACVSADCPSGPSEIIRDGENGLLVPPENILRLAAALDQLLSEADLRDLLGRNAREVARQFSYQRYLSRWGLLLRELIRLGG